MATFMGRRNALERVPQGMISAQYAAAQQTYAQEECWFHFSWFWKVFHQLVSMEMNVNSEL